MLNSLFNNVAGIQVCNFVTKGPWQMNPVNVANV